MQHEPTISERDVPPLRIHHFLMWMAVTAVLLSGVLGFDRTMRNGPPIESVSVNAALTAMAIAVSGALCCGVWGFYWRTRGYAFPVEPGERLVYLISASIVGFTATTTLSLAVFFLIAHDVFPIVWIGSRLALLVVLMGSCLYVTRRWRDSLPWGIVFYVLGVLPLVVLAAGATVAAGATLVALVVAAWNDWRRRIVRRWTHWFGVGVLAVIVLSCGAISLLPASEHWQASNWLR